MLAIELLGRVFAGADAFTEGDLGGVGMRHQGVTMMVMKADLFQPMVQFGSASDSLQRRIRAVPPGKGFESVMVPGGPGEPGARHPAPRRDSGAGRHVERARKAGG